MKTVDYWLGEDGSLGFPQVDPAGQAVDLQGLGLRVRIRIGSSEVTLPGYAASGQVVDGPGKAPRQAASIIAADFSGASVPPDTLPGRYEGVVEVRGRSAGALTTWRVVEEFILNVRIF